ncbi:MAG: hypothetical protein CMM77_11395 [Rhodospirillaceae bacterium]|nr:hypothetical protein [Magnetovibrio sp.]MAY67721.1 hypothetical protein [Rhodospirillaceae bacterium]
MPLHIGRLGLIAAVFSVVAFGTVVSPPVQAQDIRDEKQCLQVMKDTAAAIDENPAVEGKSEEILLKVMELAKQRCAEKQFDNAKDLLLLVRTMVAAE